MGVRSEPEEEGIVERGSDKHSPRADEELQKETKSVQGSPIEARAEEFREQEGPGEGEPVPGPFVERQQEAPGPEER
jgi:hypothetical protein